MVPIVSLVIPSSEQGMVGSYYRLSGSWEEPEVSQMRLKSLKEQLPDILTKPFDILRSLLSRKDETGPGSDQVEPRNRAE
jgi:hypothetical protein